MKPFRFFVFCFFLQPGWAGEIILSNGDRFQGSLSGLDAEALVLETPWSPRPFVVTRLEVSQMIFQETGPMVTEPTMAYFFRNGDRIYGKTLSVDREALEIETVWGETLRLRRDQLQSIQALPGNVLADAMSSEHPLHLLSHQPDQAPQRIAGEILTPRIVRQSVDLPLPELPEKFLVEFQTRHETDTPRYQFSILSSRDPHEERTRIFSLKVRMNQFVYQERRNAIPHGGNWQEDLPPDLGRTHRVRIYVDQEADTVHLLLNDRFIRQWPLPGVDKSGRTATPQSLRLEPRTRDAVVVETFRVLPWNGVIPPVPETRDQTIVFLLNGDLMKGEVTGFNEERFEMLLAGGQTINLPERFITQIDFPPDPDRAPDPEEILLLRSLTSGMRLHLSDVHVKDQHLEARNLNFFGSIRIPQAYLGYILFP